MIESSFFALLTPSNFVHIYLDNLNNKKTQKKNTDNAEQKNTNFKK